MKEIFQDRKYLEKIRFAAVTLLLIFAINLGLFCFNVLFLLPERDETMYFFVLLSAATGEIHESYIAYIDKDLCGSENDKYKIELEHLMEYRNAAFQRRLCVLEGDLSGEAAQAEKMKMLENEMYDEWVYSWLEDIRRIYQLPEDPTTKPA